MQNLKFAVVREDPELEAELCRLTRARALLTVASGGCTALALAHALPELHVAAFDLNPAQLRHVRDKLAATASGDRAALNVGTADPTGLNQRGEFERLFRVLRAFLVEFVAPVDELEQFFRPGTTSQWRAHARRRWLTSRYFPVAFELAFHDTFLNTMFGPAATQHAAPGSYPAYFQAALTRGLRRPDAATNPFLQHILLQRYLRDAAPPYTAAGRALPVELIAGSLPDVPQLGRFDVYSLSNIFDWSGDELVAAWAQALTRVARPGAAVLIRQLNNRRDVSRFFSPAWSFDERLGRRLWQRDRSLFYERILVGFRNSDGDGDDERKRPGR